MIKIGFLKRIVVKQTNQSVKKLNEHDFLVLNKEKVYLGRSIKECDLVFKEKIISRKHVVFHFKDGQWCIECLNDKNGVFVNGKLLKKNQVKKLEDNHIISFGPNFLTDFLYQFTTRTEKQSTNQLNLQTSKLGESTQLKQSSSSLIVSKGNRPISVEKMSDNEELDFNELRTSKRVKQLKMRVKYLEDKVKRFKAQRKESRSKLKKFNGKIKLLQSSSSKQKLQLKNARLNLLKERKRAREAQKKLVDQEKFKNQLQINVKKENHSLGDTVTAIYEESDQKIVKKYNELFSEDFTCGVCLELFLEPVTATCSHSFCKFCLNEWLKRNLNKKECPLCRTSIRGYSKSQTIENVIAKFLQTTTDQEILNVRNRLTEERKKVIEKSNADNNRNRDRHFDLNQHQNPLIEMFDEHRFDIRDFMNRVSEVSSNDDLEDIDDVDEIEYFDDYNSEDFSDDNEFESLDIVLE